MMLLIAHRGSSGIAPENTMAAFRQAVRDGASMIELDVRLSVDGVVVVIHDRWLWRITRRRGYVRRTPGAKLQGLDAGSWFGPEFAGESIPLLEEVLQLLPPGIGLNIEVKTDGDRHRNGQMARALGDLITRRSRRRELMVSSFDHRFLARFHRMNPGIPLGVLYMPVRDLGVSPRRLAHRVGAGTFVCSRAQMRKRLVRDAHASGLRILAYGVQTLRHLSKMKRYGVDGIITDYPARMFRAVAAKDN
jgi:glycerophosphoryl diester phosphodiesterase